MKAPHKLHLRYRDLRALADDPATPPNEAQAARSAAATIAAKLRALNETPGKPPPDMAASPIDYVVNAPSVDPSSGPTIVHHTVEWGSAGRATSRHVAARWWCPACKMGRNHNGRCPVCDGPTEVVPRHKPRARVQG